MTWLRAQDGTFGNLDDVGAIRYGPESRRPGVHRVTADVVGRASVILCDGPEEGSLRAARELMRLLKPRALSGARSSAET